MKRRLFKLVMFLFLGAIINISLAWGLHLESQRDDSLELARIYSFVLTNVANDERYPSEPSDIVVISFGVTHRSVVVERVIHDESFNTRGHVVIEVGWPMRTLYSTSYLYEGSRIWTQDDWTFALVPRAKEYGWTYRPELPLRPLWLGFGINSVLFASIVWGVVFLPVASRRYVRRKRGRCIECGYDLRHAEHDQCPECGMTIPLRITIRS